MQKEDLDLFKEKFDDLLTDSTIFMDGIEQYFNSHRSVFVKGSSVIHSTKKRIKNFDHLMEKIARKSKSGKNITPGNLFFEVTDIVGVRLLLLFQSHFSVVDASIRKKIEGGDWVLRERPKAFTWDPEASRFFEKFDVDVSQRETFYTSVHYLLKPRLDSPICCELQVRTLFEEIWGEIDHMINYPNPTQLVACKEQLMVLSKIVGAGSRLVDSIERTIADTI